MTQIMTPSDQTEITNGQIEKAVANYRALLVKHRGELLSGPVQAVLGQADFAGEMLGVLRHRIAIASKMIVRRIRVDRMRTSQAAIDATDWKQYIDPKAIASMPIGEGEEVDVYTFKPEPEVYDKSGLISCNEIARQYDLRGLKPDPRATAAMNEIDPSFADEHPNAAQWKDVEGHWCSIAFDRISGRSVLVSRDGSSWGEGWSFSGVLK